MKKLGITLSVITLAAGMAMGTFAWQSISQRKTNEKIVNSNPGGRIHDDFDGEKKAVYAENFTDVGEGEAIYVRIRFDEYMEIGEDAGINRNENVRDVKILDENADINDVTTWRRHKPDTENDTDPFHAYWEWGMGGSTIYMPTFNKNKDSLAVDANGSYAGADGDVTTGTPYDDYHNYILQETKETYAYYDCDADDFDEGYGEGLGNGGILETNYTQEIEEHTAATTSEASIKKMEDWIQEGCIPGNYWVWDEDGWYYWALPLNPQKTTGCLINSIHQVKTGSKMYYAIEVVGQFATAGDWGDSSAGTGFYKDNNSISANAMTLLQTIQQVVTGEDNVLYLNYGSNIYKKITESGISNVLICAGEDKKIGNSDDIVNCIELEQDLIVNGVNYGRFFLKPQGDSSAYRATGQDLNLGTADDIRLWYHGVGDFPEDINEISTKGADEVIVKAEQPTNAQQMMPNTTVSFDATVTLSSQKIDNQKVTWKLTTSEVSNGTYIDQATGLLTIASDEKAGNVLTVQATSAEDSSAVGYYQVTVLGPDSVNVTASNDYTVVKLGTNLQMNAEIKKDNALYTNQNVAWTVSGNTQDATFISNTGKLTVASNEKVNTILTIRATSVNDTSKYDEYKVRVSNSVLSLEMIHQILAIEEGSATTIEIDSRDFYVLKIDNETYDALILQKHSENDGVQFGTTNIWRDGNLRTYLNNTWLSQHSVLSSAASEREIYTLSQYDSSSFITTRDKVFMLTEADVYGTSNNIPVTDERYYTAGVQLQAPGGSWATTTFAGKSVGQRLRSPKIDSSQTAIISKYDDASSSALCTVESKTRPALWIQL